MRLTAIVTTSVRPELEEVVSRCQAVARSGAAVRLFFRDESIPSICQPDVAAELGAQPGIDPAALMALQESGDVRLYACSSSVYIWGVTAADLLPSISGIRGLIAFLAEDLQDADEILSY
ncbi:MAG: hypothetical protein EXR58_06795 [Chloroflexi bacterium]|nr:hypothetical protein [Chloroflexota bacterium]